MLGIEIISKGKFLRLDPSTKIKISLRNAAFLGNTQDYAADVIPTAFSFPTEISLDTYNRALLSHPDIIPNEASFLTNEPVRIWVKGIVLLSGNLSVREVKGNRCLFDISISTINNLKNKPLNTLALDNFNVTPSTLADDMANTIKNPDNYNYLFCPTWNPTIYGSEAISAFDPTAFQNLWSPTFTTAGGHTYSDGAFLIDTGAAVTPHPKLAHVVKKMFETEGFQLNNQFQIGRELNWLMVHSNLSLVDGTASRGGLGTNNIAWGLSPQKCSVFLRNICRRFALAPFVNFFTNQVDLLRFADIQNAAIAQDWTKIAFVLPQISQEVQLPARFTDKVSDNILPPPSKTKSLNLPLPTSGGEDAYYTVNTNPVYYAPTTGYYLKGAFNDYLTTTGNDAIYENEVGSLAFARVYMGTKTCRAVSLNQKCSIPLGSVLQQADNENRLFFYRGIQESESQNAYPFGSSEDTDLENNPIQVGWTSTLEKLNGFTGYGFAPFAVQYSNRWIGANGLYEKWHKGSFEFLKTAKVVTMALQPSLQQIISFDFRNKIAVQNVAYFVRRLDFTVDSMGNIVQSEAEMLTTV